MTLRTALFEPVCNEWNVDAASGFASPLVEGLGCVVEHDSVGGVLVEEWTLRKERLESLWQLKVLDILVGDLVVEAEMARFFSFVGGYWVETVIEEEGLLVWLITLDVDERRFVVANGADPSGPGVVKVWEGYFVLGPDGVSDDDLVDVVELVPVLVFFNHVLEQRLELGSAWNRHIECLCSVEGLLVKEVVVIGVDKISLEVAR